MGIYVLLCYLKLLYTVYDTNNCSNANAGFLIPHIFPKVKNDSCWLKNTIKLYIQYMVILVVG